MNCDEMTGNPGPERFEWWINPAEQGGVAGVKTCSRIGQEGGGNKKHVTGNAFLKSFS